MLVELLLLGALPLFVYKKLKKYFLKKYRHF